MKSLIRSSGLLSADSDCFYPLTLLTKSLMATANLLMKASQIFNASLFYQSCGLNPRVMRHPLGNWKYWLTVKLWGRKTPNTLVKRPSEHHMTAACWFKWILKAKSSYGILADGLFFSWSVYNWTQSSFRAHIKLNCKSHRLFALTEWLGCFPAMFLLLVWAHRYP